MPILLSTHSIESTAPVSTAKRGMFPCAWVLGRVRWEPKLPFDAVFTAQELMVCGKTRCQSPSCTTTLIAPLGTFVSVNAPLMVVYADAYAVGAEQPHCGEAVLMPVVGVTTAPTGT